MLRSKAVAWIGQGLLYALFALIMGVFSSWPKYRHLPPDQALIKVSFTHHAPRLVDCIQRTPEELAKLPPNMRTPMQCQRERSAVAIEVDLDGKPVYRHVAEPTGLSRDGAATVYHRLPLLAGEHRLAVRVKDRMSSSSFNFNREQTVTLKPGQVLVIDFNPEKGGITLL